ncbi:cyclase family protein [Campylobacter troglodytis]|uniref:cyclase family protein n=1 Tax=Campylobacter troglodytis TaxID=654363 RepID=UPI001158E58E|nr:cyclase family protein [Campylobacter troglodytis]TQR60360.1 cyclase [Campylobacter troglodytis]
MSELLKALNTLRANEWIELSHTVNALIPKFGAFPDLQTQTLYTVEKDGFFVNKLSFVTQYGTHIDAPCHFSLNKRSLEQLSLQELILPLVVINKEKEVEKNSDFILSAKDVLDFEEQNGKIEKGSFVAFASGWSKRWGKGDFYNKDKDGLAHTPGWSIEALELVLNQRDALAIGHETLDTDASVDIVKNNFLLSEKFVLDQNKYQVEVLNNLTLLPPKGALIFIGVPKFEKMPGFPVRAFAIVPK